MSEPYLLHDPLIRAQNPKAGDGWEGSHRILVVTRVDENKVWTVAVAASGYRFRTGEKKIEQVFSLDDWPDLAKRSLDSGATFTPVL